jgi:hypothetical protein
VNCPKLTVELRASILRKRAAQLQNGGLAYGPKLFDRPMGNIQRPYVAKPMGQSNGYQERAYGVVTQNWQEFAARFKMLPATYVLTRVYYVSSTVAMVRSGHFFRLGFSPSRRRTVSIDDSIFYLFT